MLGLSGAVVGVGIAFAATNEKVQTAFSDLFSYITHEMKHIAEPFVPVMVDMASTMKNAFKVAIPTLTRVFDSAAESLERMSKRIAPITRSFVEMLEVGFEAAAPVLEAFVGSLDEIYDGLRDMFTIMAQGDRSDAMVGFAEAFNEAIGDLLVVIGHLAGVLAPLGTLILKGVVDSLERFGDYVERTLAPAVEDLAYWLGENDRIVRYFFQSLLTLWAVMKASTMFATFAAFLSLVLSPLGAVVGGLTALAFGFRYAWENSERFRDIVNGAIESVRGWWDQNGQDIIDRAQEVWNEVVEFVTPITKRFKKIANDVITDVREWWADNGQQIVDDAVATFNSIMEDAGPILRDLREIIVTILDAINRDWNRHGDGILTYMSRNFRALAAVFRAGSTVLRAVMEVLRALITGDWSQIRRNVVDTARRLWRSVPDMFRKGKDVTVAIVRQMVYDVNVWIASIIWRAQKALANIWGTLYQAGRNLVGGFISGITSRFYDVRKTLQSLTSMLPSWKGPRSRDKKLLVDAGEVIMEGFQRGLESRYRDIRKSLGGFTSDLGREAGAKVPFSKGGRGMAVAAAPAGVNITVNAHPTNNPAEVGREVAKALDTYYRQGGRRFAT